MMGDHVPTRRVQRQRERHAAKATDRAAVIAYNRDGLDAACRALGAGEADHWDNDSEGQGDE